MATFGTPTWQIITSSLLAVMGVLLIAAAFSPQNPAPPQAILGSGILSLAFALFFLRLHLSFIRRLEAD